VNIDLHIERLVLEGLPVTGSQGARVQAAVEAELARLLAERGLAASLQAGGAVPRLPGGALTLTLGGSPAQLGAQIAQSVYSGLGSAPALPSAAGNSEHIRTGR
jgi:hypothetical protein